MEEFLAPELTEMHVNMGVSNLTRIKNLLMYNIGYATCDGLLIDFFPVYS